MCTKAGIESKIAATKVKKKPNKTPSKHEF